MIYASHMYKTFFWSITINYFLISSTYIYTFLHFIFEDILFPSEKQKLNTYYLHQLYCFTFAVEYRYIIVYLTVYWSHIYHIDGDLKLAVLIPCIIAIEFTRVQIEWGERGENRRAFVFGSLNSVKTVLSSLFISLLFFLVRWTQITHTLCGCLVGESITTRRYLYKCTNTAIWHCRQNWPYSREQ